MGQLLFQSGGFFDALGRVVWGAPMALLLLGTGLYLSCRLGWVQLRHFGEAMRGTVGRMSVSYTHLDVYKRQSCTSSKTARA